MVKLNPDLPDVNPQQTLGYSRGRQAAPGKSNQFSELFSDVVDVGLNAVDASDFLIQKSLKSTAQEGIDQINEDFGVEDAATLSDVDAETRQRGEMPAELNRSFNNVKRLGNAYRNGDLSNSTYWARLHSLARQIRNRYPGYREQVDNFFQSETGALPANALRRSLLQEALATTPGQKQANRERAWTLSQVSKGLVSEAEYNQYSAGTLGFDDVAGRVATRAFNDAFVKRTTRSRNLSKLQTLDNARAAAIAVTNAELGSSTASALGVKDLNEFRERLLTIGAQFEQDKQGLSPELQSQLINQISQLRNVYGNKVDSILREYPNLTNTDREDIKGSALGVIDQMQEAIANKDVGLMNRLSHYLEATETADQAKAMQDTPIRSLVAIKNLMGDQWAAVHLQAKTGELLTSLQKFEVDNRFFDLITDDGQDMDKTIKKMKDEGITDPKQFLYLLDSTVDGITNPKVRDEGAKRLINQVYNPSVDFMKHFNARDWATIYSKMTSPPVRDKALKFRETDPELWNKYSSWVKNNFVDIYSDRIDTFGETALQTGNITYDADKNQFGITPTGEVPDIDPTGSYVQAQRVVDDLNIAIRSVAPIFDSEGRNTAEEVSFVLNRLGVRPSAVQAGQAGEVIPEKTLGSMLYEAIQAAVPGIEQGFSKKPEGYTAPQLPDAGEFVRGVEQGFSSPYYPNVGNFGTRGQVSTGLEPEGGDPYSNARLPESEIPAFLLSLFPVTGEISAIIDAAKEFDAGNVGAGLFASIGAVPGAGITTRLARKGMGLFKAKQVEDRILRAITAAEKHPDPKIGEQINKIVDRYANEVDILAEKGRKASPEMVNAVGVTEARLDTAIEATQNATGSRVIPFTPKLGPGNKGPASIVEHPKKSKGEATLKLRDIVRKLVKEEMK